MTQVALSGLKTVLTSAVCGAISSGAAWGTRYVSQIPTQDVVPAGIVGSGMTLVTQLLDKTLSYAFTDTLAKRLKPDPKVDAAKPGNKRAPTRLELQDKAKTIISTLSLGIGFLASTGAAPTVVSLVGKNISYEAAALFSLLNIFSLFVVGYVTSPAKSNQE